MSLQDTVRAGVETAFAAAADFVSTGPYYVRTGPPTYDPVADVETVSTATLTVRMLRSSLQAEEREASPVGVEDVKILVPGVDFLGNTPSDTDWFVLDGVGYNVVMIKPVPGNSLWIIFGRKK